ncbi:MAG TPA: urease subunit gamma, partial [Streptosporangiaceae bacterium]|nr:urease subunit gamma [Streptosporangiaceae bacterium]
MMAPSQERSRRRSTYPVVPGYVPAPDVPTPMQTCPRPGRFDTGRDGCQSGRATTGRWGGASSWACGGAVASMYLSPADEDRLRVFAAAELARRTLARGLRLNAPEAVALACDE